MRLLGRILLFLLVLVLLTGLLMALSTFYTIPWLSGFTAQAGQTFPSLNLALSIVLVFFIALNVLALILLVTVPTKRRIFTVRREMGRIDISPQSIVSAAEQALSTLPGLRRYSVAVAGHPSPGSVKLDIQAEPKPDANLVPLGDDIRQRVTEALSGGLDITPQSIHIRMQPVRQAQQGGQHARVPRVV